MWLHGKVAIQNDVFSRAREKLPSAKDNFLTDQREQSAMPKLSLLTLQHSYSSSVMRGGML